MTPAVLALAALLAPAPSKPLPRTLPPVEQCGNDPQFKAFRSKLTKAVDTANRDALLELLAPDVQADLGGGQGPAQIAEQIDNAGDELWMYYKQVIHLGCVVEGDARVIPSLAVQFDPWNEDEIATVAVALPGVKLRETPDDDSRVVTTLKWDVLQLIPGNDFQTEVVLPDGRKGWLFDSEFTTATGYRFWIEKRDGKWMVTALIAGD